MTWEWASGPDPARYTQLLKLAYTAIKSVNPQMPVIGGALATDLASTATSAAVPLPSFLQAMYAAGAKGSMDGLSIHPYPEATDLFYTFEAISDTLEIRDANGDSAPLWVTETGLARGTFTAAQQGLVDSDLLRALSGYPGIAGTYLSTLVDPKTASAGLGLLSPTLSAYPAFCTVALAAGGTVACPSGVTVPAAGSTQLGRWQAQNLLAYASNAAISYYASHGSYTGISSAALHALDSRLSATAADGTRAGATADPTKIGVYALSPTALLLCNASRADLSYCTGAPHLKGWRWWSSTGSAYNAASVAMHS
jgi:hypothetical protein